MKIHKILPGKLNHQFGWRTPDSTRCGRHWLSDGLAKNWRNVTCKTCLRYRPRPTNTAKEKAIREVHADISQLITRWKHPNVHLQWMRLHTETLEWYRDRLTTNFGVDFTRKAK